MLKSNIKPLLTLWITALLTFGFFATMTPVGSGLIEGLAWHEEIMVSTTFTGLVNDGDDLSIFYEDEGTWNVTQDIHNYLIYKTNEFGLRDLQAHIELAKIGDTTYLMEIYHSVPNWKFGYEMPFENTIRMINRYIIVIELEAELNDLSTATGYFPVEPPVGSGTGDLAWYEEIMANTTISGLMYLRYGDVPDIVDKGDGNYGNGNSDVHFYLIYKTNESGVRDLQAHIELAKIGDTTYLMEIYHSNPQIFVDMPYEHDTSYYGYKVDYFMKIIIEADL